MRLPAQPIRGRHTLFGVRYGTLLRAGTLALALGCLAIAANLAFDWADYADSTCGSLVRYKGAGGTCARIMHGRVLGVIGLVVAALALIAVAWTTRSHPRRTSA
ncbi:MAG: hypothetical protein QOH10_2257 [Actinomycetota bacterium]|nr:hypothetical protein [Actinomycetota bacterium]